MVAQPGGPNRINQYLFLTYLITLVNTFGYLSEVHTDRMSSMLFIAAVYLIYSLLYLSPAILLVWLIDRLIQVSSRFAKGAAARR